MKIYPTPLTIGLIILLSAFAFFAGSISTVLADTCLDSQNITTFVTIGSTVQPYTYPCAYGCNQFQNVCNTSSPYSIVLIPIIALLFFLGNIFVMFLKIYNVSTLMKAYEKIGVFLTIMFSFLSWLIVLTYALFQPTLESAFYLQITNIILLVNIFLTVLECLMLWTTLFEPPQNRGPLKRQPGGPSRF